MLMYECCVFTCLCKFFGISKTADEFHSFLNLLFFTLTNFQPQIMCWITMFHAFAILFRSTSSTTIVTITSSTSIILSFAVSTIATAVCRRCCRFFEKFDEFFTYNAAEDFVVRISIVSLCPPQRIRWFIAWHLKVDKKHSGNRDAMKETLLVPLPNY